MRGLGWAGLGLGERDDGRHRTLRSRVWANPSRASAISPARPTGAFVVGWEENVSTDGLGEGLEDVMWSRRA
jgi:hypothetical protein